MYIYLLFWIWSSELRSRPSSGEASLRVDNRRLEEGASVASTMLLVYTSVYTSLAAAAAAGVVVVRMTYLPREAEALSDRAILIALYSKRMVYIYDKLGSK